MRKSFPLKKLLAYALFFLCFLSANSIMPNVPFSAAIYIGILYFEPIPLLLAPIYLLSFFLSRNLNLWYSASAIAFGLAIIFAIYRAKKRLPKAEIIIYVAVCLLPFVFLQEKPTQNLVYSAIIGLFAYLTYNSLELIREIGKRAKPDVIKLLCFGAVYIGTAIGALRLFNVGFYLSFGVLCLLCFEKITLDAKGAVLACILAIPIAITQNNSIYLAVFFLWFVVSIIFMKRFKPIAALAIVAVDAAFAFFLGFYQTYDIYRASFILIPALFFAFLPDNLFIEIRNKLSFSAKEMLCKNYINRNRIILSSRLYEISGVFFQMQTAFSELKKCSLSKENIVERIASESVVNICSSCVMSERCSLKNFPEKALIERLVDLGIKKNHLTLIDLPRDFIENCSSTNSLIFEINRLIGSYIEQIKASEGLSEAKQLLSLQVEGLAKVMKSIALDYSKTLPSSKDGERKILRELLKYGIYAQSALMFGEDRDVEICIFTDISTSENPKLIKIISQAVGKQMICCEKTPFSDSLVSVVFKVAPKLDAVFGVSSITKNGSQKCGDTHSLVKIDEGKFLIALSDGMGSGIKAETTSSTSLNLIESFYRAGLESELILSTVNKVLALSVDDNFAAIDMGIVDLYSQKTDFIKIGAPYGFLLSDSGVKFLEGSSLPLGILEEVSPSSCTENVSSDDVIIMVSDGITDSFGSSSDMIEFLKTAPKKNPQALSDSIVAKALMLSGNVAKDDMTALCVRLIDKIA